MKYYPTLRQIKTLFFLISFLSLSFAQQSAKIELKLADQFSRTGDFESALKLFKKHYKNGDRSTKVLNGLNRCLRELNYTEERISFLEEVATEFPKLYNYKIDLGSAYYLNQQTDIAMQIWEEVYAFEPGDVMRYRRVAQAMTSSRLFDEAIDVYKKGLAKLKNQEVLNLNIGNLYRVQLDYENATFHFLEYYKKFKKMGGHVRSQLINMAKDDDATDRIIKSVEDFNTDDDPDLNELLSNLYIRKKDYNNALGVVLKIEDSRKNNTFGYLYRFAKEAEKDRAYIYVIKAYESILQKSSTQSIPEVELKIAYAYYQLGLKQNSPEEKDQSETKIKRAQTLLQNLIEKKTAQKFSAAELLGDIHKQHYNDLDRALSYYQEINIKRISKTDADRIYFKIADIYILKNQLDKALEEYRNVSARNSKFYADYNIAEIDYYRGQFSKAKEKYNNLLSQIGMKDTLANNVMDRIFEIDMFINDSADFAQYSGANLLKKQNKYSEAAGKFKELFLAQNVTSYYAGINSAKLYNQLNNQTEANSLLKQVIELFPDEEQIDYAYFLLANNYRMEKDFSNALTFYQEILTRFPTSLYSEQARSYAREINTEIQESLN